MIENLEGFTILTRKTNSVKFLIALFCIYSWYALAAGAGPLPLTYPPTRQTNQVDDYHGVKVTDPYRWLEDDNSRETKAWVEAQNKVTFGWLEKIPERKAIKERLTRL